jgi:hypothetical protein
MNSTRQHLVTAQTVIAHARRGPAANRLGGAITAEQSLIVSQSCKDSMKTRLVLSSDWGAAPRAASCGKPSTLPVCCGTNKNRRKKPRRRHLRRPGSCRPAQRRVSREASKRPSGQVTLTLSCSRERLSSVGLASRCSVFCLRLSLGLQACFNGHGRWRPGCFRARGEAGVESLKH